MSNRETKSIKTPGGHDVVLYSYVTGREVRQIDDITMKAVNISPNAQVQSMNTEAVREAENKMLELVVVSVDGSSENLLDVLLDMRSTDYAYVLKEVEAVVTDKEYESNKKK